MQMYIFVEFTTLKLLIVYSVYLYTDKRKVGKYTGNVPDLYLAVPASNIRQSTDYFEVNVVSLGINRFLPYLP